MSEILKFFDGKDTLELLNSEGTFFRIHGIFKAVRENDQSSDVIERIRQLKKSAYDVLNFKESEIATAADFIFILKE